MYIRCSVRREGRKEEREYKEQGIKKRREREGESWNCDSSDYFLRLTSRLIFNNRENGLPYFTYVVAVISV